METLEINQMEKLEGGGWASWVTGAACAGLIVGAVAGGPAGAGALAAFGPSVCIAGGIISATQD